MPVAQLTLWDNEALESGYHCLADLELDEAVRHFNNALKAGIGNENHIAEAMAACEYWQPRIHSATESHTSAASIKSLLEDYRHYPFTRMLNQLKKAILQYIIELLYRETDFNENNTESAFDFLIAIKEYQRAENFISNQMRQYPDNGLLIYLLAQSQWRKGNKAEANKNYARAFLYYPDKFRAERVENSQLQSLAQTYGPAMAPAYAWILGFLPFINLNNETKGIDENHLKAINGYRLLQEAHKSLENNDIKSSLSFRKKMQMEAPDLYRKYFEMLNQRR